MKMRTNTWTRIGHGIAEAKNIEQALQMSGLDYTVEKRPVFMQDIKTMEVVSIPNRFVTVRHEDGHHYDVVSDKFEIVQNRDAFDFVNYMGEDLQFEKAGETSGGMVYIIAKLPEVDILGDAFTPHVIFRNGFSGKVKITAAICPLRMVCQNQFNFAFKEANNSITVRHVQNAEAKLEEARETLRMSADYMAKLNEVAEGFATMKLSSDQTERVVNLLFPKPEADMNAFKRNSMEKARNRFLAACNSDDNSNFRGTAWGLVNAYTDYVTHKEPSGRKDTRFEGKFITTTFKTTMNPVFNAIETVA